MLQDAVLIGLAGLAVAFLLYVLFNFWRESRLENGRVRPRWNGRDE